MAGLFAKVSGLILIIVSGLILQNAKSFACQGDDCDNPMPVELNEKFMAYTDDTYSWWWFSVTPSSNGKIKVRLWNTSDGLMSWLLAIGCCRAACIEEKVFVNRDNDDSSEYYTIKAGETVYLRIEGDNGSQDFEAKFYFLETTPSPTHLPQNTPTPTPVHHRSK